MIELLIVITRLLIYRIFESKLENNDIIIVRDDIEMLLVSATDPIDNRYGSYRKTGKYTRHVY